MVARIFQKLGVAEVDELSLKWRGTESELMCALIHACHDAGPTGGTYRRSNKGILEERRLASKLIHVGCLDHRVSHGSHCIPPLIICEYDYDVGALLLGEEEIGSHEKGKKGKFPVVVHVCRLSANESDVL